MAPFRYRLQVLLDQKVKQEEAVQQHLLSIQRTLRAQQQELDACRREQEHADATLLHRRAEIDAQMAGGAQGEWWRIRRNHLARLQEDCLCAADATRAQQLRVTEEEENLESARRDLAACSRAVEVLEKHRERLASRHKKMAEQKEALEQEEMANVLFLQKRSAL